MKKILLLLFVAVSVHGMQSKKKSGFCFGLKDCAGLNPIEPIAEQVLESPEQTKTSMNVSLGLTKEIHYLSKKVDKLQKEMDDLSGESKEVNQQLKEYLKQQIKKERDSKKQKACIEKRQQELEKTCKRIHRSLRKKEPQSNPCLHVYTPIAALVLVVSMQMMNLMLSYSQ